MNMEQRILEVAIEDIIPNRFQPRLTFDDKGLDDLAASIKQHGIIQPLVLRRIEDKYEIIAGERRYKAATMAGLKTVPAIIADIDDNKSAEVAIVENVQRRDLSAIEEARSYKNLLDKGYLTQSELAKKMGLSQSAIANKLRLLNLDDEVQNALLNNEISERHARSLLVLEDKEEQRKWLKKILENRMTVREVDEALKDFVKKEPKDDTDVPLIKPLDIEAIKKEATELPNINEESDIARKIREIEQEKMFNPDIIPVEQAANNSKSSFFNFLENETVNMNTEEPTIKAPLNFTLPSMKENVEEEMPTKNVPLVNEFDSNNHFGSLNNSEEKIESIFDPVDLIETLDPEYENKMEAKMGLDLKTAINEIRNLKEELSTKGFQISLEETDLNEIYQFVIKIKND